jgi:hypothetical protein
MSDMKPDHEYEYLLIWDLSVYPRNFLLNLVRSKGEKPSNLIPNIIPDIRLIIF